MFRWEMSKSVPDQSLRLNWVYGYRGHQCRSNLHFNCEDDVVYFIAACGIVYNPKYHKQGMIQKNSGRTRVAKPLVADQVVLVFSDTKCFRLIRN